MRIPLLIVLASVGASGCLFFDADEACSAEACDDGTELDTDGDGDGDGDVSGDGDGDAQAPEGTGGAAGPSPSAGGNGGEPMLPGGGANSTNPSPPDIHIDLETLRRLLKINEVGFASLSAVELYNSGDMTIELGDIYVTGQIGDYENVCQLSGVLRPDSVMYVQEQEGECLFDTSRCIAGCELDIRGGGEPAVYYLRDETSWEFVDSVKLPPSAELPTLGRTWTASPDGSDNFDSILVSLGEKNDP